MMRQTISGLVAAFAVMTAGAAPALACGSAACSPCGEATYVSPCAPAYTTGCAAGCGDWAYQRLADPDTQYYYVNEGPTYDGPGAFAPYPTYQQSAVSGWGAYRHHPYYHGYDGAAGRAATSYRWHHHYHFLPRHYSYRYGRPVLRRYD
jgi:hypothetical protein